MLLVQCSVLSPVLSVVDAFLYEGHRLSGAVWHVVDRRSQGAASVAADWLLSSSCTLCGTKMSEDHILNCRQTHLYRVMRHDAIVCWLYDHLVSRRSAP